MKIRKIISIFFALVCILIAFGLFTVGASAAEGAKTVYATTSASLKQGSYGYLYVYLDDLTDLSALNVSVYYDTEMITVKSVTNRVSSVVNDLATGDGQVNASYIFDGNGTAAKTNLFYIYYQVNSSAEIGDTYFDIVVNEAYNSSLEGMDFTGSRCSLEITEKTVTKSCSISSSSNVSTSVGEEFELSYRLSTYQIASGSMNIQYDPELFEVVSVTNGGFLTDKIADINTALDGTIAISFVGTTYNYQYDVVKVRFKTLKNVTETSEIKLIVTDFYDEDLNLYSCSGCTTKASIAFDESYIEDAPSMSVSSSYNAEIGKVTATIKLEKDSMLGAGDFVLKFDTRYLTYVSAEKGFSPTFFNINDKNSANGILKFSIISLSDITDEQIILTVVFDAKHYCQEKTANFEISGSGLTDSLTNTIPLNFVDSSVIIPLNHTAGETVVENNTNPTCTENGSYDNVVYCTVCKTELLRETVVVNALGHNEVKHEAKAPTCTEIGWDEYVACSRCDYTTYVEIPKTGHTYEEATRVESTCIAQGYVIYACSCGETKKEDLPLAEHTEEVIPAIPGELRSPGMTSGVKCSVCGETLVAPVQASGDFRVGAVSLNLGENVSIVYKVAVPAGYENVYMVFQMTNIENGVEVVKTFKVEQYEIGADGRYWFTFSGIRLQYMADLVTATVYAEQDGIVSANSYSNYSVKSYITGQLAKASNSAELKTMLSDLLILGAKTQIYANYRADNLMTADVDASILTPSTYAGVPSEEFVQKMIVNDEATRTIADWKSVSLTFKDAMSLQFKLAIDPSKLEGIEIKVYVPVYDGTTRVDTYTAEDFTYSASEDRYILFVDNIKASQYGQTVVGEIYYNGEQISRTVNYSVNSYIQKNQDNSNVALRDFLRAAYQYGLSVFDYAY